MWPKYVLQLFNFFYLRKEIVDHEWCLDIIYGIKDGFFSLFSRQAVNLCKWCPCSLTKALFMHFRSSAPSPSECSLPQVGILEYQVLRDGTQVGETRKSGIHWSEAGARLGTSPASPSIQNRGRIPQDSFPHEEQKSHGCSLGEALLRGGSWTFY